jgi:hypothetical protein
MSHHQESKSPAAGDAADGANGIAHIESSAAITAAALILRHTRGLRNHVLTVRRAERPRHGRDWLVSYNGSREFSIKAKQLRNPIRFSRVMSHANPNGYDLEEVIDLANYDLAWPREMDDIMSLIGGAT